jgi:hypothetical protein
MTHQEPSKFISRQLFQLPVPAQQIPIFASTQVLLLIALAESTRAGVLATSLLSENFQGFVHLVALTLAELWLLAQH